jgi:hypothetical protein
MKPGSVLIELAPHSHSGLTFFEIMAKTAGIKYFRQTAGIQEDGNGGEFYHIDPMAHLTVLEEALNEIKGK